MNISHWKFACGALILTSMGASHAAQDSYRFSDALDLGSYKDFDGTSKTGGISRSNVVFVALENLGGGWAGTVELSFRNFLRIPNTKENLVNENSQYLFAEEATAGFKGDFGHARGGRAQTMLWQND